MKRTSLILIVFSVLFSLEMLRSGWYTHDGLVLYGVNKSDGVWNLALIEELQHHFPPEQPGFAFLPLRGYHFLYHLLVMLVSSATFISKTVLYFQIFPLATAFLWGYGVYKVVYEIEKDNKAALWSAFFSYFGSSFAFILPLMGQQKLSIDSGLGISQPLPSSLPNPAFASSVVILIWAYFSLLRYIKSGKRKWVITLTILCGISVGFKIYVGMILMGAFFFTTVFRAIFEKKYDLVGWFVAAVAISGIIFVPFNANVGFLTWAPFWPLFRLIEGPLNFTNWDELWREHQLHFDYFGIFTLSIISFAIFFFGNIGTRLIMVWNLWIKRKKLLNSHFIFYLSMCGISFGIPMMFLQPTGGGFNIVQMNWYFLFLLSLFTGYSMVAMLKNRSMVTKLAIITFILVLTIPSPLLYLVDIIKGQAASIPKAKLELLDYLASYKTYDTTILEIPYLSGYNNEQLENWFWRDSNVIIPALGIKRLYLGNENVPYPYDERLERYKILALFGETIGFCRNIYSNATTCNRKLEQFMSELKVRDIQLLYVQQPNILPDSSLFRPLTGNQIATIYEVLPL